MITTIVNYCTNDYRFLEACLYEAGKFSNQIIVPVCDHFFNGHEENRLLLEHSYAEHPDVRFIEFAFDNEPYGHYSALKEGDPDWIHYWHSTARYVGYQFVPKETEYVFFIDVDEIVDGEKFKAFPYNEFDAIRFTSYFYFREARFRAKKIMKNGLLVRKEKLSDELLLDVRERGGTFDSIRGNKFDAAPDGEPLVHHYSWVKTKEEILQKVVSWGHHLDKDWKALIEKEYSTPFQLKDHFWGFDYEEVTPERDPLLVRIPSDPIVNPYPNVTKVDRQSINRKKIFSIIF